MRELSCRCSSDIRDHLGRQCGGNNSRFDLLGGLSFEIVRLATHRAKISRAVGKQSRAKRELPRSTSKQCPQSDTAVRLNVGGRALLGSRREKIQLRALIRSPLFVALENVQRAIRGGQTAECGVKAVVYLSCR